MFLLNLPPYVFKTDEANNLIFDEIRKKYVKRTPEEWVRQNFIRYLHTEKNYPLPLISVEHDIRLNSMSKRCDAVVFSRNGFPVMILEFKAPSVKITQRTFDQIYRYNLVLNVEYLLISNGLSHFACKIDLSEKKYEFLKDIPQYGSL